MPCFGSAEAEGRQPLPFDAVADYDAYVDGKPREDGVRSFLVTRGSSRGQTDPTAAARARCAPTLGTGAATPLAKPESGIAGAAAVNASCSGVHGNSRRDSHALHGGGRSLEQATKGGAP